MVSQATLERHELCIQLTLSATTPKFPVLGEGLEWDVQMETWQFYNQCNKWGKGSSTGHWQGSRN